MARTGNRTTRRQQLNMRVTDEIRAKLEAAAEVAGRNLTQEVEWRIEQSFEWQAAFGEAREWLETQKSKIADIERGNVKAALHRLGWHPLHTPDGDLWAEPGVYKGPKSGFRDPAELTAPAPAAGDPNDLEATIKRAVIAALRETLPPTLTNRPSPEGEPDPTPDKA